MLKYALHNISCAKHSRGGLGQATCDLSPTPLPCSDLAAELSSLIANVSSGPMRPTAPPDVWQSGKEDTVTPLPHYLPVTAFTELMSSLKGLILE